MDTESRPIRDGFESLRRIARIVAWPVWNLDTGRVRAPIRALLPLVVTFLGFALVQSLAQRRFDGPTGIVATALGFALVLAVVVPASARLLDRRPVRDYGLSFDREWWRSFAAGALAATVVNAGTLLVSLAAGWVRVSGFAVNSGDALSFPTAALVVFTYIVIVNGAFEEFAFRGAMLTNLAEGAGGYLPRRAAVGVAVVCSSLVFAYMHSGKVAHVGQYGYYLVAGLVLGGAYVVTGELALSIGFHAFYDFTMSVVFGLGVSQQTPELVHLARSGRSFWIGETGVLQVVFAVVGGLLLVGYARVRDGRLRVDERLARWRSSDATTGE
ncbi:membrane protease YdiL (CAAX protease family) [Halarchaeum solikamskense]|uniref:CPBP family intramembrane glutamic endopeptidase n=1 Tax=Halarchaeum nitratireducens TaxID=489913 RepID=UPI00315B0768|nr:membrane protease YdiL (CAAX protease family) [Halarchaeum solikamskense]